MTAVPAYVDHGLTITRGAFGGWHAGCTACPEWAGRVENTRVEATWHHAIHARDAAIATYRHKPRHHATPVRRSAVNVDKVLTRLVAPLLLFVALPAWILWTGIFPA